MMLEDEPFRLEGVQHATEEERRTSKSSSRANEVVGPKPKRCSAADVPGRERKVQCCKEKYCGATCPCPPLFLSSMLDAFQPEGLIFQHHIF